MKFDSELAAGKSLVYLGGSEAADRLAALSGLMKRLAPADDDFDVESFPADSRGVAAWFGSAGTTPFLSDYRVVVVRNLGRVDPEEAFASGATLSDYARGVPESGRVILVGDDEMGTDTKIEGVERRLAKWKKLLEKAGAYTFEFKPLAGNELVSALREKAAAAGKKLSQASASLLSEMTGGNSSSAFAELEKVILFVGDSQEIREADLRASVIPDVEYKVFTLIDAIVEAKSGVALAQLHTLFGRIDKIEDELFRRVFPLVARQFRLIWQARACVEENCHASRPTLAILEAWPEKQNLGQEKEWTQNRAMTAARRLDYRRLGTCLSLLADADAKVKGARPAFSSGDALEQMVLAMCAACR